MSGMPAGEVAHVRGDDGQVVFAYRSFASVVGIVAALMSGIVLLAGITALGFLVVEEKYLPAVFALLLATAFAIIIAMLVPTTSVTLYEGTNPAISIVQESSLSFPVVTYRVKSSEGRTVGRLRKSVLSRLGRNRWLILPPDSDQVLGYAIEESLGRALLRKVAGKFDAGFQSNMRIRYLDRDAGHIVRRPDPSGIADVLDLTPDADLSLDRRVAVALATLVLGSEP